MSSPQSADTPGSMKKGVLGDQFVLEVLVSQRVGHLEKPAQIGETIEAAAGGVLAANPGNPDSFGEMIQESLTRRHEVNRRKRCLRDRIVLVTARPAAAKSHCGGGA